MQGGGRKLSSALTPSSLLIRRDLGEKEARLQPPLRSSLFMVPTSVREKPNKNLFVRQMHTAETRADLTENLYHDV